jgi:uncharacterized protein YkwD
VQSSKHDIRKKILPALFLLLLFHGCSREVTMPEEALQSSVMLDQVNQLRQSGCQCGTVYMPPVPPLKWNTYLQAAAEAHAKDMYANNYFNHIAPDGSSPIQRAQDAGYTGLYVGENIARGYPTLPSVMLAWQNSESHCEAMMDSLYSEMGAGRESDYWVQEFGRPH